MRPFGRTLGRKPPSGATIIPGLWHQRVSLQRRSLSLSSGENSAVLQGKKPRYRDMAGEDNYQSWTKTGLIQRVKELEHELRNRPAPVVSAPVAQPDKEDAQNAANDGTPVKKPKGKRKMDPSKYSTRYIALKFAYLGKNYGGYEFQAMANLPSIEEELWNALTKACLIFPKDERVVDFDCCEYSKCGRTDRGVSAFGQVIGLRVRSNRPLPKKRRKVSHEAEGGDAMVVDGRSDEMGAEYEDTDSSFDPVLDEIHYPRVLNRILPPDIRVLAWCPSPPSGFSARFSCRERQYRYFFTQPAFAPEPTTSGSEAEKGIKSGWLDIEAMRDAAKRYEGEHDFRNVCKIDPAKQITNFRRNIYETDIEEVKDVSSALPYLSDSSFTPAEFDAAGTTYPKIYCFKVRGSAFLWHQIRHMVALLFLVGQRLEAPSLISELLDVETNPRKPNYVMADEIPLVLWDCVFAGDDGERSADALEWIHLAEDPALNKFGQFGVMDGMWALWRERKMDELLANQLLQHISRQGDPSKRRERKETTSGKANASILVYEGGNSGRMGGRYIPIMKKDRLQAPEDQNDRYAKRKGFADSEDMRRQKGFRNTKTDDGVVE